MAAATQPHHHLTATVFRLPVSLDHLGDDDPLHPVTLIASRGAADRRESSLLGFSHVLATTICRVWSLHPNAQSRYEDASLANAAPGHEGASSPPVKHLAVCRGRRSLVATVGYPATHTTPASTTFGPSSVKPPENKKVFDIMEVQRPKSSVVPTSRRVWSSTGVASSICPLSPSVCDAILVASTALSDSTTGNPSNSATDILDSYISNQFQAKSEDNASSRRLDAKMELHVDASAFQTFLYDNYSLHAAVRHGFVGDRPILGEAFFAIASGGVGGTNDHALIDTMPGALFRLSRALGALYRYQPPGSTVAFPVRISRLHASSSALLSGGASWLFGQSKSIGEEEDETAPSQQSFFVFCRGARSFLSLLLGPQPDSYEPSEEQGTSSITAEALARCERLESIALTVSINTPSNSLGDARRWLARQLPRGIFVTSFGCGGRTLDFDVPVYYDVRAAGDKERSRVFATARAISDASSTPTLRATRALCRSVLVQVRALASLSRGHSRQRRALGAKSTSSHVPVSVIALGSSVECSGAVVKDGKFQSDAQETVTLWTLVAVRREGSDERWFTALAASRPGEVQMAFLETLLSY